MNYKIVLDIGEKIIQEITVQVSIVFSNFSRLIRLFGY